jgi:hypothetical protein
MSPHQLSALFLTLSVTDFRKVKRIMRTLGSLGVYDFDSIVEQVVLGIARKKQDAADARSDNARRRFA